MRKPRTVSAVCVTTQRIPSINSTYQARVVRTSGGKYVAQVYTVKEAREFKREILDQLDKIDFEQDAPWIFDKKTKFTLNFRFIIKSGMFRSDTDNRIKICQDCLFKRLGLNDSRVIKVVADKVLLPGAQNERVCFCIEESFADPIFSNLQELPRPLGIFLGGTCAGDPWRKTIEPWLEEHRYDYYDPVVPDWTPDCIQAENNFKENKMDCFLALLTPKMKGVYSIAEIMNEIMEVREGGYGSVLLGVLGSRDDWGEGMWRSLNATVDLINGISQGSKQIVASFIENPLDICQYLNQDGWKGKRKPTK